MKKEMGGLIGYYELSEWWLSTFTKKEQKYIIRRYKPIMSSGGKLVKGRISFIDMPVTQFLNELSTWFNKKDESLIKSKISEKIDAEAKAHPIKKPGFFNGRHFTTFVEEVKQLKRDGKIDELEKLLWNLVYSIEEEDKINKWGVAPWYYEELAKLFRKSKDYKSEIIILSRYSAHQQDRRPCTSTPILLRRLERAKELNEKKK